MKALEHLEETLLGGCRDAHSVVLDPAVGLIPLDLAADFDMTGLSGFPVFHCVADQIGKNLAEGGVVGVDFGQRGDRNLVERTTESRLSFSSL